MITDVVMRHERKRVRFRPAGETINPLHYEVAAIPDDTTARLFIVQHHYAASYPSARFRFGLYWGGLLVGVAVFSHPINERTLAVFPGEPGQAVELGRLVLLDFVPGNAESWFIARCFELLRKAGVVGVVSFSDPVPRATVTGRVVLIGHVGVIYQATNALYTGTSKAETKLLLPDGLVLHARALAKIRARDSRIASAIKPLYQHGAARLLDSEDAAAWVTRWTGSLCRRLWHTGNHRYLFALDRATKKHLLRAPKADDAVPPPKVLPYPRINRAALGAS